MSIEAPDFEKVAQDIAANLNNFVDWQTAMRDLRETKRAFEDYRRTIDLQFQRGDGRLSGQDSRFSTIDTRFDRLDRFTHSTEGRLQAIEASLHVFLAKYASHDAVRALTARLDDLEAQLTALRAAQTVNALGQRPAVAPARPRRARRA